MIDLHNIGNNSNWGILPYFNIFGIQISTYSFFVLLGLIIGLLVFWIIGRKDYEKSENSFYIIFFGILGGALGAKIPIWIAYFDEIKQAGNIETILSGRTITGGLIGGFIAVYITKKILKEKTRFGNAIAPGVAIGIAIGRIGCFLHGCCYGIPTKLPWGVDFGDGILRHPTQIYEIIYLSVLATILIKLQKKELKPGILFDCFLIAYFSFRFFIEFIRVEPKVFFGFSLYQIAS
ncbi:MAG: prolipoprotein diacylglyceryl transferase, partial [Candidatus Gracilibacteria bacterium]|nr:prolipoprotein diacylglyceryl transferase [Candidatus Gracilibacteria bacterium]